MYDKKDITPLIIFDCLKTRLKLKDYIFWQKIHKNHLPTEKISESIDYRFTSHVKELPSDIQDTTDKLKIIKVYIRYQKNAILAFLDGFFVQLFKERRTKSSL